MKLTVAMSSWALRAILPARWLWVHCRKTTTSNEVNGPGRFFSGFDATIDSSLKMMGNHATRRVLLSAVLALSLGMGAAAVGGKEPADLQRDQYFRCQGLEYIDAIASSQPGKALLQLKSKTVQIAGVFMFADSEVAIVSETDTEILFDGRVSGTALGSFGVFNKATRQLRADTNHGEPRKVTHHTWGEYACKPVKF